MSNDLLLKAISWTLLHSIWQGFIIALLAGVVIVLTRKMAAAKRYNLLSILFIGFIIVVGFTFNHEFQNENTETVTRLNFPETVMHAEFSTLIGAGAATDISAIAINFLNKHSTAIALVWFLIFAIKIIGMFGSLSHVYCIRNYKTQEPSLYWKTCLDDLSNRIQLKKKIILLESRLVKVPSVTGFFKPIILIPIGLLSNLPQQQVEAILLHELAHIKREDYCINLLQRLCEMVFFFNPGILWLSSILKAERENCCDDIAIAAIKDKTEFIQALVAFEEYQLENGSLALGFAFSKNHLLNRAKRILNNHNKTLNDIEKTMLSAGVLLTALVAFACSNIKLNEPLTDVEIHELDSKIAAADSKQATIDSSQAKRDVKQSAVDKKQAEVDKKQAMLDSKQAAQDLAQAHKDLQQAEKDLHQAKIDLQISAEDSKMVAPHSINLAVNPISSISEKPVKPVTPRKQSEINMTSTTTSISNNHHSTVSEAVNTKNGVSKRALSLRTGITGDNLPENMDNNKLTNAIISDLFTEKIINNGNNLSYNLSDKSLIVNGIVQSEHIYKKLRAKYITKTIHSICYNYQF